LQKQEKGERDKENRRTDRQRKSQGKNGSYSKFCFM